MKKNWIQSAVSRVLQATPPAEVVQYQPPSAEVMEKVLLTGDLASLTPAQRLNYYDSVCRTLKLNALTKPFEYITLNGKLTLYARKDCTDQLRRAHGISLKIVSRELFDGVFNVVARATMLNGREDESVGSVFLPAGGEGKSNAMMKAETKAKRRVTLSICGLGMFDESELDSIPAENNTAEDKVRAATANATAIADRDEIDLSPVGPITEDNFGDVVCHVGQAGGSMLGKDVQDINKNVLEWLRSHFGEGPGARWGNPADAKDQRLYDAVSMALKKL